MGRFLQTQQPAGRDRPDVPLGPLPWKDFAAEYLIPIPDEDRRAGPQLGFRRGGRLIVRPHGFLPWTTK